MTSLDKRIIHGQGGKEQTVKNGRIFYCAIHNNMQFKMYELLISGIFRLISSDCNGPLITEAEESEAMDNVVYCIQLNSNIL